MLEFVEICESVSVLMRIMERVICGKLFARVDGIHRWMDGKRSGMFAEG